MTNLTALIIATREDIVVDAGGPDSNGKYTGWITLGVEDRFRPLINSDPVYDSKDCYACQIRIVANTHPS
jgi:hypothetical protein